MSNEYYLTPADEYLYEDSRIRVKFKGVKDVTNLFYGDGVEVRFLVENKTSFSLRVTGLFLTFNDFLVDKDSWLVSELIPNKKTVDGLSAYHSKLEECDIYSASDIEDIELQIATEILIDGNTLNNSKMISPTLKIYV